MPFLLRQGPKRGTLDLYPVLRMRQQVFDKLAVKKVMRWPVDFHQRHMPFHRDRHITEFWHRISPDTLLPSRPNWYSSAAHRVADHASTQPQQFSRNHPAMHLGGPVIDTHVAHMARHQLQWSLLGHSHRAKSLHCLVYNVPRHLGGKYLDHRDLAAHIPFLVKLPRGVIRHQAARSE